MNCKESFSCKICFSDFDLEHRRPRVLSKCGHSFCTTCIKDIIKTNKGNITCPNCRSEQIVTAVSQLNINYSIEEMMSPDPTPPFSEPKVAVPFGPKLSAGFCNEHGQHQLFHCNTCNVWICHVCTVLEHPREQCTVVSIKKAIECMKKDTGTELGGQISKCYEALCKLDSYDEELEEQIVAHQRHLVEQDNVMGCYKEAVNAIQTEKDRAKKVRDEGYGVCRDLETLRGRLDDTVTVQEVNDCLRDLKLFEGASQSWRCYFEDNFPDKATISRAKKMQVMTGFSLELMNWDVIIHLKEEHLTEIVQATKGKLLQSLIETTEVFAVIEKGNHKCFAPITWEGECFTFGALQDHQPPANAVQMPLQKLLTQTAPAYAVVQIGHRQLASLITCVSGGFSLDTLKEIRIPANSFKIPLLDTLVKAGLVYAVAEDGQQGAACLSRYEFHPEPLLLLHVLRSQPLPHNIFKTSYSHLRKMVDEAPVSAFLDLEWRDNSQEKVLIRLDTTSGRGQQFLALCTGERGPSYVNTKLLNVHNKGQPGELITGGDYENNDGSGGAALLSGLTRTEGMPRKLEAGLVSGHIHTNKSSQFLIYTRSLPETSDHLSFGKVVAGLDVLMSAAGLSNPQDVVVKDCGVVVPVKMRASRMI